MDCCNALFGIPVESPAPFTKVYAGSTSSQADCGFNRDRGQDWNCVSSDCETNYIISCGIEKNPARFMNTLVESQILRWHERALAFPT